MTHKIINVEIDDINRIKEIYKNGEENKDDISLKNPFNFRVKKEGYDIKLVKSELFFCDLRNKELLDIIKKYIKFNENIEYISNAHHINYIIGEEAKEHVDTGSSIRTYILLLNDNFKGGDFYLNGKHIPLKLGEMIEFNADILHSVKPIEEGNREVFVVWIKKSQKNEKTIV